MSSGLAGILVLGVLLLIVVAGLAYTFIATGDSESYPDPAAQVFIDRCVRAGGDEQTCSCMVTEAQERYSLDEFIRLGLRAQNTGQIPDELQGVFARCRR